MSFVPCGQRCLLICLQPGDWTSSSVDLDVESYFLLVQGWKQLFESPLLSHQKRFNLKNGTLISVILCRLFSINSPGTIGLNRVQNTGRSMVGFRELLTVFKELRLIGNQLLFHVSDVICLCEIRSYGILTFSRMLL